MGKFYTLFAMQKMEKTDKHQVLRSDYTLNKKHSCMHVPYFNELLFSMH